MRFVVVMGLMERYLAPGEICKTLQNVGNKRIFTKSIGARTFSSTALQLQYFTLVFARTCKVLSFVA